MKLKVRPEDFRVHEEVVFPRVPDGAYYVHVLRKQKLDTQQALTAVARLAGVARADVAFAGLKDRQGVTEQWITIRGRRLDHRDRSLHVAFRGRTDRPLTSRMSTGNRFEIVVRGLDEAANDRVQANAQVVMDLGLPNYFDDQRFGGLRHGQGFPMRDVLLGDFERALQRMVAQPSPVAITGDVKLKRLLARHWGDWAACAGLARGPAYRRLFEHLVARPHDFLGALDRLPTRQKLIHAFAYQSLLWNRAVHRLLLGRFGRRGVLLQTRIGRLLAWHGETSLESWLERQSTPLFAPGAIEGSPEFVAAARQVVGRERLTPDVASAVEVAGMVLRSEPRELRVRPRDLRIGPVQRDETERGCSKIAISFGMPRGSYATLVVKRLLAAPDRATRRKPFADSPAPSKRRRTHPRAPHKP